MNENETDLARMSETSNSDVQPAAEHLEATPHDAERPAPMKIGTGEPRSMELLRATLSMICNFIWTKQLRPGEHMWSIPVDKERDFDGIISDAFNELEALRTERDSWIEREAAICPEDVGFEEYIARLRAERDTALQAQQKAEELIGVVVQNFSASETLGYRSRDRQYALEIFSQLDRPRRPEGPNTEIASLTSDLSALKGGEIDGTR